MPLSFRRGDVMEYGVGQTRSSWCRAEGPIEPKLELCASAQSGGRNLGVGFSPSRALTETVVETTGWRDKFTGFLADLSVADWVHSEIYASHFNILPTDDSGPKPKILAPRCKIRDRRDWVIWNGRRVLKATSKDVHNRDIEVGLCG